MLGFHIPNRLDGEKIILHVRRHPFVLLVRGGFWLLTMLIPPILYFALGSTAPGLLPGGDFWPLLVLGLSIYYLYIWLFIVFSFVDYYLDVWIITNERIINIEQHGLFRRTLSQQKLFRVQDVTAEHKGFFSTVLNYGDVFIQTAGEKERFVFKQVPSPTMITKKIINLAEENRRFHHIAMEV